MGLSYMIQQHLLLLPGKDLLLGLIWYEVDYF